MDRFWRWVKNEAASRILVLEGYIAEYSWFDDDVTPKAFREDLYAGGASDDIIVRIHSPGGDCFAAAQIYNMLKEYPGRVAVQIDGLAASAASVIAMAGDEIGMSPVSVMMAHNPSMMAIGEAADLEVCINLLSEVKESIINAYEAKTGISRVKLAHMMDAETWMSAHKAVELGFADTVLYQEESAAPVEGFLYDTMTVTNTLANKLPGMRAKLQQMAGEPPTVEEPEAEVEGVEDQEAVAPEGEAAPVEGAVQGVPIHQLERRLELIKNWR